MLQLAEESASESRKSGSRVIHVCSLCGVSTCALFDSVCPFSSGNTEGSLQKM